MMKSPPIFAISAGDSRRPEFIQSFVMDSIPCTMKEQKRSCSRLSASAGALEELAHVLVLERLEEALLELHVVVPADERAVYVRALVAEVEHVLEVVVGGLVPVRGAVYDAYLLEADENVLLNG